MSSKNIKLGTDGWRAIIAEEYTFENVRLVAHAVARTFDVQKAQRPKVYVGYDHRFMSREFAREAAKALAQYHFEPRLLPIPVTSPWLSFITWKEKSPFGVMITASHNPAEYCGFKVKGGFGGSIPQETAAVIEKQLANLLSSPEEIHSSKIATDLARIKSFTDFKDNSMQNYLGYLKSHIDRVVFKRTKAPIVFDAMYGPGARIVSEFFKGSQARIELIHDKHDPLFGGLHPEPIEEYLGDLKAAVKKSKAAGGFALDGDGDRLGVVDEKGNYLTPQQVFALLLYYLAKEKKMKGKVVQAVSLGYLSERIAKDFGLPFEEVPVGFKYVAERMLREEVLIGGEESGGYAVTRTTPRTRKGSIIPERDGLLSAMLLMEAVAKTKKTVSELLKEVEGKYGASAYHRKDCELKSPIADKEKFIQDLQKQCPAAWENLKVAEIRTLDGLKIVLEDGSSILVRPSGTEPLLRTYAEFPKAEMSLRSLEKISKLAQDILAKDDAKHASAAKKSKNKAVTPAS